MKTLKKIIKVTLIILGILGALCLLPDEREEFNFTANQQPCIKTKANSELLCPWEIK